ncbi:hypothetical protein P691DRAFT_781145 [Macrolepiota fuliginosa MF-IS2]|uniref:protein-serine/threonine phosphatase n=1 Tax=Macrolepiota fuliginosa MF-IS2 TaxID=1400762 RepID=A0A9P5WYX9_9AGAR|nr:hypothetical protein P691DRAFT_781145 [Macrolepiota fuliginosa MF-IS2]
MAQSQPSTSTIHGTNPSTTSAPSTLQTSAPVAVHIGNQGSMLQGGITICQCRLSTCLWNPHMMIVDTSALHDQDVVMVCACDLASCFFTLYINNDQTATSNAALHLALDGPPVEHLGPCLPGKVAAYQLGLAEVPMHLARLRLYSDLSRFWRHNSTITSGQALSIMVGTSDERGRGHWPKGAGPSLCSMLLSPSTDSSKSLTPKEIEKAEMEKKKQEELQGAVSHKSSSNLSQEITTKSQPVNNEKPAGIEGGFPTHHPEKSKQALLKNDDVELDRIGKLLSEVHRRFFKAYNTRPPMNSQCKQALADSRKHAFSGIILLDTPQETTKYWQLVHMFGAKCYPDLAPDVTHVIMAKHSTKKVETVWKCRGIKIV